ncbi:MAG: hypothetical protein GXP05_04370 [Alphaproteobacteria bacterium]|nr:hypothetical protein [Alphaproteobacteria bacterium]
MIRRITLLILLLTLAEPAQAGPLIGLLTGAAGFTGAITIAGIATTSLGFRLLATVALSAISRALQPKPKLQMPQGIRTQYPTAGGVTPQTFMLGYYASEGNRICPDYTFGSAGGTPNAYLVKIRDFGDVPGMSLGRVMINKQFVTLAAVAHPDYGFPVLDFREGTTDYAWVKYYDGSQIAADPFMLAQFGADPDYPWSADMVGTGICYAIFTFRYNRERFSDDPSLRCEFTGIPLYDPRKDTTVGGAGTHRWGTLATYQTTTNPQIMKYNILRGITLPDGSIWGGEAAAPDVPLSVWFAAMNECDVVANGETAPQFQAGLEISVDQEPADIIDELDKTCLGQTFEAGGVWKTRSGAPGLPVYFFTDDDVIITEEQELDPFPGLESTYNGLQATFPDPNSLWNPKEAPPRYNPIWEAQDQGRRLIANIQYNAAPYSDQVQRLMVASVNEERRFRRHTLVLPPDAAILEPLRCRQLDQRAKWVHLQVV